MPSTYSTNLRLELQATGENATTWGIKANNLFNMVEQALTNVATIAMADANKTLTVVNGTTDQSRCMFIRATGALTANRTITIPQLAKFYIFQNSTTGGFSITVSNTVNTVSVTNGEWSIVWTDGTNIYKSLNQAGSFATVAQLADLSGVSNPSAARTNLGLGTMATQNANAVAITGGGADFTISSSTTGTMTANGFINTGTYYRGTATNAIFATLNSTGDIGTISLRPSGYGNTTNQTTISGTNGDMTVYGGVQASSGVFRGTSSGDVILGAGNASGGSVEICLRPRGYADSSGQTTIHGSDGHMTVNGNIVSFGGISAQGTIFANQNFTSNTSVAVFANSSAGSVILRANGSASTTNQFVLTPSTATIGGQDVVTASVSINAGNGLTGGGTLATSRTITMGTPTSISNSSTNNVTTTSHSHALSFIAAEVYPGTDASETSLPVGSIVYATGTYPNRNATGTVRLSGTTTYTTSGAGSVLSGTWRSRGGDTSDGNATAVYQRVA